jgi:hypothetical protein
LLSTKKDKKKKKEKKKKIRKPHPYRVWLFYFTSVKKSDERRGERDEGRETRGERRGKMSKIKLFFQGNFEGEK